MCVAFACNTSCSFSQSPNVHANEYLWLLYLYLYMYSIHKYCILCSSLTCTPCPISCWPALCSWGIYQFHAASKSTVDMSPGSHRYVLLVYNVHVYVLCLSASLWVIGYCFTVIRQLHQHQHRNLYLYCSATVVYFMHTSISTSHHIN